MSFGFRIGMAWRMSVLLALLLFVTVASVSAQDVAEMDLAQAKTSFEAQRLHAAETSKKRAALQQSLEGFDVRVEQAKKEIEKASKLGSALADKLKEQQSLLDSLADQRRRVEAARGSFQTIALRQDDDLRRYARLVAARDIAMTESGPVFAGSIIRHLTRPSLGDSIQMFLERRAVMTVRRHIIGRLKTALYDAQQTEGRLHAVAGELTHGISDLIAQRDMLDATVKEQRAFVDTSWKEKQLTEQQLQEAAAEAAESSDRLAAAQESLVAINEQLKTKEMDALRKKTDALKAQQAEIGRRIQELDRKDAAMHLIEDAALKAYAEAMDQRNTDKKLYRRLEDRTLERDNLVAELARNTVVIDDLNNKTRPYTPDEAAALSQKIAALDARIELMKQGIPDDAALAYLQAKDRASDASAARTSIADEKTTLAAQIATLQSDITTSLSETRDAERRYALDDLPPMFAWPVTGPITAGFMDPDYEKVFHFVHRAIDIAVPQGSTVHAIADGVVIAVRDGGAKGYSYVLIGHRNGFASLYGHVLKFLVAKGDVVTLGQPIALSGGQPGTPGSGESTTGPHVHLELTQHGVHKDPRFYLPRQ